jgi:hypothetical protein
MSVMRSHAMFMGVGVLVISTAAAAAPPTKRECIVLNESGQDLRREGRLRGAIERFEACAVTACPEAVRDDCTARLEEARRATPALIVRAKSTDGTLLTEVKVVMDGRPLVEMLDGSPVHVDPGEHTFDFRATGFELLSKRLKVGEGPSTQTEEVTLSPVRVLTPKPIATSALASVSTAETRAGTNNRSAQPIIGIVLGALGVVAGAVGAGFGLSASSNHDAAIEACPRPTQCRNVAAVEQGNLARDQAKIANVAFIGGAVLAASGVVVYLTAPSRSRVQLALSDSAVWLGSHW